MQIRIQGPVVNANFTKSNKRKQKRSLKIYNPHQFGIDVLVSGGGHGCTAQRSEISESIRVEFTEAIND